MRIRTRTAGLALLASVVMSSGLLPSSVAGVAAAATCTAGTSTDFNGDSVVDTVVADPNATVSGVKGAGLVRVILGGGKGIFEISQATPGMNAAPEPGDGFGTSRTTYDADGDGCTDLVVGVPYEDITKDGANLVDAGAIYIVHGTPTGIGEGSVIEGYSQSGLDADTTTEAYDWFGQSVKGGETATGAPYLVVGVPGENVVTGGTDYADAGCVHYIQGSTRTTVNQNDPGVPGTVEAHDRFGYSVAGTNRFFGVGIPGEAIEDKTFAGGVAVFNHTLANGVPTALAGFDQDAAGVTGTAETDDGFGTSIAMTGYRPSDQTYNSDVLLAVGTPGEDIGTVAEAGGAAVFRIQPSGTYTETAAVDAAVADVEGDPVAGDFLGQRVAISNTNTNVVTTADTVRLAVGIPGKDVGAATDAGAVQVFRPLGTIGAADRLVTRGSGLPGAATRRDHLGMSLTGGANNLYVGVPFSKASGTTKGVLHVVTWADLDGTTSTGATTYQPGSGGLPDNGVSFGVVG